MASFAVFIAIQKVAPRAEWLLVPPLLAELCIFCVGVGLLVAALYVRFRDVVQIWELTAQLLFFASAIFYPINWLLFIFARVDYGALEWLLIFHYWLASVFFYLFIFAIGYKVGPQFFQGLKGEGLQQALLSIIFCLIALATIWSISTLLGYDKGLAAGLVAGAVTESANIFVHIV